MATNFNVKLAKSAYSLYSSPWHSETESNLALGCFWF